MIRRAAKPTPTPEWIVAGLGNPGPEYRGTRHNLGFEIVDALAAKHKIKLDKARHRARFGIGEISGTAVLLAKPLTFMNLSGQAIAPLAREYGVKPERILVVADDLDLPVGRARLKPKGSAGGHNGHKSIIHALGTEEYPRLKIGIGSVDRSETVDHVLSTFRPDERDRLDPVIARCLRAIEAAVGDGLERGMEHVNAPGD